MEEQIKDLEKRIAEIRLQNSGMAMQIEKLRRQLYYAEKAKRLPDPVTIDWPTDTTNHEQVDHDADLLPF